MSNGAGLITRGLCALIFACGVAGAQDSDRDGLPDAVDSCPQVVYFPQFDPQYCGTLDLDPDNDTHPECKARERVARFLASQPTYATKIAFSVVKNGKLHFAGAFEHVGPGQVQSDPDGVHRLFRIGSTSKPFTAVAAKILEEQGSLSLADYVSDDDASKVTVGGQRRLSDLLSHQGAFRLDTGHIYLFGYPGNLAAFWAEVDDSISPHYDSTNFGNLGGGYEYSAFNYSLAGAYIANRSGQSFADTLQSLVFDPASMASATLDGSRANLAPIGGTVGVCTNGSVHLGPYINLVSPADPYCVDNFYSSDDIYGQSTYTQQSYRLDECSGEARDPAGGVMASVVDMAQFARQLLASYHDRGGLLSKQGIRDLWTPSHDLGCTSNCPYQRYYAYGFFVDTTAGLPITEVEHAGSRAGYHSVFVIRPEADTAVSILVNANVDVVAMNQVAKAILDDFDGALPGGFFAYGASCPSAAENQLSASGTSAIGGTTSIHLQQARPAAGVILAAGFSNELWGAFPLPLDLSPFGAPGCHALTSAQQLIPLGTDAAGAAQLDLPIPNNSVFAGARVFFQALVLGPGGGVFGAGVSHGGELRVGG